MKKIVKGLGQARVVIASNRIFVSRYQLYLPDREQLRRELAIAIETEERNIVRRQKGKVAKR